jgi:hypothetical protein
MAFIKYKLFSGRMGGSNREEPVIGSTKNLESGRYYTLNDLLLDSRRISASENGR